MDTIVQPSSASSPPSERVTCVQQYEGLIFTPGIVGAFGGDTTSAPFEMRCIECGKVHEMDRPAYACTSCGNLLEIRMDRAKALEALSETKMRKRPLSVWRYGELIPIGEGA